MEDNTGVIVVTSSIKTILQGDRTALARQKSCFSPAEKELPCSRMVPFSPERRETMKYPWPGLAWALLTSDSADNFLQATFPDDLAQPAETAETHRVEVVPDCSAGMKRNNNYRV